VRTHTAFNLLWPSSITITMYAVVCSAVLSQQVAVLSFTVLNLLCCAGLHFWPVPALQSVRVATALNWQMVCGCVAASDPLGGTFDPVRYNSSYAAEFAQVRQQALPLAGAFKVRRLRVQQTYQVP
jgi:hypothetical protein